jgi:hypothetical protein
LGDAIHVKRLQQVGHAAFKALSANQDYGPITFDDDYQLIGCGVWSDKLMKGWVKRRDIPNLSIALLREYIEKTAKTVKRDIDYLLSKEMVVQEGGRVRTNREAMVNLLPQRPDRPPPDTELRSG